MRRSPLLASALAVLACLTPATPVRAAWPHDPYNGGLPVITASNHQLEHAVCPDGAGGAILAWQDYRGASIDIYAQRINAAGVTLWAANGVAVCTATGTQGAPAVTPDGAGGVIIAWTDARSGLTDVYVQRLNASGVAQWTANGVTVCNAANAQDQIALTSDGSGGAVLVWRDARSGVTDLYAQRVSAAGATQWTANGVTVCNAIDTQSEPSIVAGAGGSSYVVWTDLRNWATSGADLFGQGLNASGAALWAANGVTLVGAVNDQSTPSVIPNPLGSVLMTWTDDRMGISDIWAGAFSATGNSQWTLSVCSAASAQVSPLAVSDGSGGMVSAWRDYRVDGTSSDVYAARITAGGTLPWTGNGVALCTAGDDQVIYDACSDGAGGLIAVWYDLSGPTTDVAGQRVNANGSVTWGSNGVVVSGAIASQTAPRVVTSQDSDGLIFFSDARSGQYDVYAQRVDKYGKLGSPEPAITQVKDVAADQGGSVKVSWSASYLDADPTYGILEYRVFRSAPVSLAQALAAHRGVTEDSDVAAETGALLVLPSAASATAWEYVGTQTAEAIDSYSKVVATTSDSGLAGNKRTLFMVEARTSTSLSAQRWFSAPDSGYSVDNLAPLAPAPLTGQYATGTTRLHWNPNAEADLAGYRVYRGTSVAFTPSLASLVEAVADTGYADAVGAPYVYKVTAVDVHGNESPVATLIPSGTLGVNDGLAGAALEFAAPQPNPARGLTTLRWSLSKRGPVRIALYDAAGRRVASVTDGIMDAGAHSATLALRDGEGRELPSGLYLARFEAEGRVLTRRIAAIR